MYIIFFEPKIFFRKIKEEFVERKKKSKNMSGSPPPFDQETRNETEVEVDLSSNQTESKLDDNDLFFSTISDPNLLEKVKLNFFV